MQVNQRGWIPINEDDPMWTEEYYESVRIKCDALAKRWSQLHHEDEQESFARRQRYDDGDFDNPYEGIERRYYDSDEEYEHDIVEVEKAMKAHDDERRLLLELRANEIEFLETALHSLGVRMMRPYEHWNEDEQYMEYMERDR